MTRGPVDPDSKAAPTVDVIASKIIRQRGDPLILKTILDFKKKYTEVVAVPVREAAKARKKINESRLYAMRNYLPNIDMGLRHFYPLDTNRYLDILQPGPKSWVNYGRFEWEYLTGNIIPPTKDVSLNAAALLDDIPTVLGPAPFVHHSAVRHKESHGPDPLTAAQNPAVTVATARFTEAPDVVAPLVESLLADAPLPVALGMQTQDSDESTGLDSNRVGNPRYDIGARELNVSERHSYKPPKGVIFSNQLAALFDNVMKDAEELCHGSDSWAEIRRFVRGNASLRFLHKDKATKSEERDVLSDLFRSISKARTRTKVHKLTRKNVQTLEKWTNRRGSEREKSAGLDFGKECPESGEVYVPSEGVSELSARSFVDDDQYPQFPLSKTAPISNGHLTAPETHLRRNNSQRSTSASTSYLAQPTMEKFLLNHDRHDGVVSASEDDDLTTVTASLSDWRLTLKTVLRNANLMAPYCPRNDFQIHLKAILTPSMDLFARFGEFSVTGVAFLYTTFQSNHAKAHDCAFVLTEWFFVSTDLAKFVAILILDELRGITSQDYKNLALTLTLENQSHLGRLLEFNPGFMAFLKYSDVPPYVLTMLRSVLSPNARKGQKESVIIQCVEAGLGVERDLARFLIQQFDEEKAAGE
jgi:hypothetical protein